MSTQQIIWPQINPSPSGGGASVPSARLTLTTGLPVTTSDVTGASNVYWTPYNGNQVTLWDGSAWTTYTLTEQTMALSGLTSGLPYDVFAFQNSGTPNIEKLAWSNGTTRATTVTIQDGRYCKNGDKTRLYLGTFYTTGTTTTEDSGGGTTTQVGGKRFLWNMYNRVLRYATVIDTTDTWSYTTHTIRQANGASGNKVECVVGISDSALQMTLSAVVFVLANSAHDSISGIGVDTTTSFSGPLSTVAFNATGTGGIYIQMFTSNSVFLSVGYHYLSWNESGADVTCVFLGDNNGDGQTGLTLGIFA